MQKSSLAVLKICRQSSFAGAGKPCERLRSEAAQRKVGLNDDRASLQYLNSSARVAWYGQHAKLAKHTVDIQIIHRTIPSTRLLCTYITINITHTRPLSFETHPTKSSFAPELIYNFQWLFHTETQFCNRNTQCPNRMTITRQIGKLPNHFRAGEEFLIYQHIN